MLLLAAILAAVTTPPPPAPPSPIQWPAITEKKLDNGLTVVLVPLHSVPKVSVEFTFMSGRGAAPETPGVAQLAGRLLTEGTPARTSLQLKEELRSIGGSMNAYVTRDGTTIAADSLAEFSKNLFELLADVAQHPAFPKSEVDLAKTNFASEIEEQRSSPQFLADEQLAKSIFGKDPYGFVVPEPAAIGRVTREQLKAFAAARYVPNNAHVIIVGDFEVDPMFATVRSAFGGWKKSPVAAASNPTPPKRDKRQIDFVDRPGSVQSTILIGAIAPPRSSEDYVALRTATRIFGGAFYSRLTRNIREGKGYTYSPYSLADLNRRAGVFYASAEVRNEVTGPTILEMLYELDRMRVMPVTDEELDAAKVFSIGNLSLEIETQSGLASRINTIYTYGLAKDFLQTFQKNVSALKAEDIQRVAAKYFDTYRSAVVIVGDYAKVKDQVTPFGEVRLVKSPAPQH
jgi:predicted Zn-dependent peptidase